MEDMKCDGNGGDKVPEQNGHSRNEDSSNGVSPSAPSKKKQKQVHGILKNNKKSTRSAKGGVVWDEDNLIYNESHKSATMKIDEPPTPYNKDYDSGTEDDDEESTSSEKETKSGKQARERTGIVKTEEESKRANFIDEVNTALEESKRKPARRPRFSSDEDTTEDDEALGDHAEFKKKRSQHYNEWKKLQEFRRSHSNDASENEDNGDEEEEDDDKDRDDDDTRTARALRT